MKRTQLDAMQSEKEQKRTERVGKRPQGASKQRSGTGRGGGSRDAEARPSNKITTSGGG